MNSFENELKHTFTHQVQACLKPHSFIFSIEKISVELHLDLLVNTSKQHDVLEKFTALKTETGRPSEQKRHLVILEGQNSNSFEGKRHMFLRGQSSVEQLERFSKASLHNFPAEWRAL